MFAPIDATRTAPTLGPCWSEDGSANLLDLLTAIGASSPDTYATIGAMFYMIVQAANHAADTDLRTNCRKMFTGTAYGTYQHDDKFPADPTTRSGTANTAAIQVQLGDNLAASSGWLLDLVNAAKKKPLDEQNVTGYFASIRFDCAKPIKVAKFINTIAPYLADMISLEASRNLLSKSTWTDYRVSRCSTGKVLKENSAALKVLGVITDAEVVTITTASESPWDITLADAIPKRIKGFCAIYLDASGRGIDKWYQGNKAMDAMPAAKVRATKVIFKAYLDAVNDTSAVASATTASEVIAAIPAGFFT